MSTEEKQQQQNLQFFFSTHTGKKTCICEPRRSICEPRRRHFHQSQENFPKTPPKGDTIYKDNFFTTSKEEISQNTIPKKKTNHKDNFTSSSTLQGHHKKPGNLQIDQPQFHQQFNFTRTNTRKPPN